MNINPPESGLLIILVMNSICDIIRREILLVPTLYWGAAGIIYTALFSPGDPDWMHLLPACVSCGVSVILLSALSGGGIGMGDGILLAVCGIWLGPLRPWGMLASALIPAMMFSLLPPVRKTGRLPLVPFLTAAYLCPLIRLP